MFSVENLKEVKEKADTTIFDKYGVNNIFKLEYYYKKVKKLKLNYTMIKIIIITFFYLIQFKIIVKLKKNLKTRLN